MKKLFSILFLGLSFTFISSFCSAETEESNIIIVLDASGSMWGKVDNEHKIVVAKSVVQDLVKDWESSSKIGLMAYGHRRKGDCSDIETLIAVGEPKAEVFKETLSAMSAKGKTPLSKAVMMAAEELKYTENKATVILVSDGIETCKKDPCKIAKSLEEAGVDFTAHVIGFDLSQKDQEKIKCIADNTGGRFLAANNAKSLSDSLNEVIETVKVNNTGVQFYAVNTPGGEPLDVDSWYIFELDQDGDPKENYLYNSYNDKPKFKLTPGKYQVKVKQAKVTHEEIVEVKDVSDEKHEIVIASQGKITLAAVDTPDGEPLDIKDWLIYGLDEDGEPKDKAIYHSYNDTPEFTLLPGKYLAKVNHAKVTHEETIEVISGKNKKQTILISQQGKLKLTAINTEGGEALNIKDWLIYELDSDGEPKDKAVYHTYNDTPEFTLLPGKYLAKVNHAKVTHKEEIEVVGGKTKKYNILIPMQGNIRLTAIDTEGGEALNVKDWRIFKLDQDGEPKDKAVYHTYNDTPEFTLLPGKYLAKVTHAKVVHKEEIEVIAGKTKKYNILIPMQGSISLSAIDIEGGEALDVKDWRVFELDSDGEPKDRAVYHTYKDTPKFTLLPGKYLVKVTHAKVIHQEEIEVIGGKSKKLNILIKAQGRVKLKAVSEASGEALDIKDWKVHEIDEDGERREEHIAHTYKDEPKFTLLPGRYLAIARYDDKYAKKKFEITPRKLVKVEVIFE